MADCWAAELCGNESVKKLSSFEKRSLDRGRRNLLELGDFALLKSSLRAVFLHLKYYVLLPEE